VGGVLTLEVAWQLAKAWYEDRLEPTWRRRTEDEERALFAELGMTSVFWSPGG
jgi:hypothetical protein